MKETINNKVLSLRTNKGITQQELADAIGVTRQTIIAIEKGNYIPSLLLAFKIAEFFEKDIKEVFVYEK